MEQKERWGTRIGLVLAMAGNAVGLGNFLRFPGQAAQNGGASFMIPYLICMVLLGFPLMWVAWTIGRRGGQLGHHTTPGMFASIWHNPLAKYLGALGILLPFGVMIFYTYVESWTLGYAWASLTGAYADLGVKGPQAVSEYLDTYLGENASFAPLMTVVFFTITLGINFWVLNRGISGGIEKVALFGMPLLIGLAIILAVYVNCFMSTAGMEGTASEGLGYLWNLDFQKFFERDVFNGGMWLAAAGQIFFTLSIGLGSLECYSSYLSRKDDITLSGLATSSTNQMCEVVIGGSLAIPAATVFFGISTAVTFGTYGFGFNAFPAIFATMGGGGRIMGFLFFALLFVAALTSSLAMGQPAVAFLQDRFKVSRHRAVTIFAVVQILCSVPLLIYGMDFVNEIDFWVGTFGLVFLALFEILIFNFALGIKNGWREMHAGAQLRVPGIFKGICLVVTPLLIIFVLFGFFYNFGTRSFEGSAFLDVISPFGAYAEQELGDDAALGRRSSDAKLFLAVEKGWDGKRWEGARVRASRPLHLNVEFTVEEGRAADGATRLPAGETWSWIQPGSEVEVRTIHDEKTFDGTVAALEGGWLTWKVPPPLSIRRLLATPGSELLWSSRGKKGLDTFVTTIAAVHSEEGAIDLSEPIRAGLIPGTPGVAIEVTPPKPWFLTLARLMLLALLAAICIAIAVTSKNDRPADSIPPEARS